MTERVLGPTGSPRRKRVLLLPALVIVAGAIVFGVTAAVGASLPGSKFEIDTDANLVVNTAGNLDWATVDDIRRADLATGQTDDSYQGGVKEDTACPDTTTGSIPNNKSDLLTFGSYFEPEAGGPGWLHVFWRRVQEPSGTTNMDFEFNKSTTDCDGAGPSKNVTRTVGDILLQFDVDQGGAVAKLSKRTWQGSAWSDPAVPLGTTDAIGDINDTAISTANSDSLGAMSARTFGEASFDLSQVFDPTKCESFGSAMLKSRSSDSFTSQLKDFIAPIPVNITNCGTVIIRKQTDPDESPETTEFDFTKAFNTDPSTSNSFKLKDDGVQTFNGVLFGSGYTVAEGTLPAGWDFVGVDCSTSSGVTPDISGKTVTFSIDNASDVLDCTYTNRARGTIIVKKVSEVAGTFGFTSGTLSPSSFNLTTTAAGEAGSSTRTFSDLTPGTYDVAETVPAGWNLDSSTCSDGSLVSAIVLSGGETVTCTFTNSRERGAILITKTRKHAASGSGSHPHAGVTFTVTGGSLPAGGTTVTTNASGQACLDGLVLSSFVGNYTVTETVPAGYVADGLTAKTVTVVAEATCTAGTKATVSFANTPLTNLTISIDSQVDGGTASSVACTNGGPNFSTGTNGDGSGTASNLTPKFGTGNTIVCTIVIDP